ncbi:LysR substrate-binding domain-containing protein [Trinickia mobilis]|uniref:LysR substrate-binding domain-containing protein n=1 Tax=Trinickia mobilis TaxID=2816356 RepID=UPI001A8CB379|nr:LysR substrate-binding domain-containing protein [Trinickia mobilis]
MEIRQLKYFIRIVELGSMSRAAADLFIAQPALSQQMVHLESELNVKLLARSVRGVTPTEAGSVFYRHAQAVLRQLERMREDVQSVTEDPCGVVSIGMPTSVANILAAPLMLAMQSRYPKIQLRITESLSGHLEELIANGRLELSVLFGRERQSSHLTVRPLVNEQLFFVCAQRHGHSSAGRLTLEDAARERFILPSKSNATRQLIERIFSERNLDLQIAAELDSLSTIASVVSKGLGATITSLSAVAADLTAGKLVALPLEGGTVSRLVSLCTYDIVALSAPAQRVAELIPLVVHELLDSGEWRGATAAPQLAEFAAAVA